MKAWRGRLAASFCLGLLAAWPARAADAEGERARIAAERAAIESRWAERDRECGTRFIVTACREEVQRERRAALAVLRRQEIVLDEAARRERALAQQRRLDEKARARAEADAALAARPPRPGPKAPPEARPHAPRPDRGASRNEPVPKVEAAPRRGRPLEPDPRPSTRKAPAVRDEAARREAEAAHRAAFEKRAEEAQRRRETAERRAAERAASGKAARPLPLPGGASQP